MGVKPKIIENLVYFLAVYPVQYAAFLLLASPEFLGSYFIWAGLEPALT